MKVFLSFLVGLILGMGLLWFIIDTPTEQESSSDRMENMGDDPDAAENVKKDIKETVESAAEETAEETADFKISATIKAKLAKDPDASAINIDVDTTDGVVTLSGKVPSQSQADKAIQIAKSVQGVKKVASTLLIESEEQNR